MRVGRCAIVLLYNSYFFEHKGCFSFFGRIASHRNGGRAGVETAGQAPQSWPACVARISSYNMALLTHARPCVKPADMPIPKKTTTEQRLRTGGSKRAQGKAGAPSFNARIEGIDYDVLEELTGYAVRRAQLSIYEDFSATLGMEGITPQRFSSLVIIGSNPGISQTRLAEVMGIARSGVVSIIDNFEQAGLVERQDSGDRRAYKLRLSADGQRQLKKYKNAVRQHDDRVTQQLTAEERQQLRSLLGKLCIGPKS